MSELGEKEKSALNTVSVKVGQFAACLEKGFWFLIKIGETSVWEVKYEKQG